MPGRTVTPWRERVLHCRQGYSPLKYLSTICNSKLPLRQMCKPHRTNFNFLMHQVICRLSFSFWHSCPHTWALTRLKNDWLCPLGSKGSLSCAHWAAFHRWGGLVFSQIPKRSVPKAKKRISIILPGPLGTIVACWAPAPVEKKPRETRNISLRFRKIKSCSSSWFGSGRVSKRRTMPLCQTYKTLCILCKDKKANLPNYVFWSELWVFICCL